MNFKRSERDLERRYGECDLEPLVLQCEIIQAREARESTHGSFSHVRD